MKINEDDWDWIDEYFMLVKKQSEENKELKREIKELKENGRNDTR